jgi:hypothetical protein
MRYDEKEKGKNKKRRVRENEANILRFSIVVFMEQKTRE